MGIGKVEIELAMADGVVFACAMCKKFWWGRLNGYDSCKAVFEKKKCGGPLAGMAYPEYEGPLAGSLQNFCFVCGDKSDAAVESRRGIGPACYVGVCETHIDVLKNYTKPGESPPFVTKKFSTVREG